MNLAGFGLFSPWLDKLMMMVGGKESGRLTSCWRPHVYPKLLSHHESSDCHRSWDCESPVNDTVDLFAATEVHAPLRVFFRAAGTCSKACNTLALDRNMDLRAPHSAGTVPMVNARTCWLLHDGNEQYIVVGSIRENRDRRTSTWVVSGFRAEKTLQAVWPVSVPVRIRAPSLKPSKEALTLSLVQPIRITILIASPIVRKKSLPIVYTGCNVTLEQAYEQKKTHKLLTKTFEAASRE